MSPSVLLGSRRTLRPLELIGQGALWAVNPLFLGSWMRYRAISAATVAAAMLGAARSGRNGANRYSYSEMRPLAAAGGRASVR
jgi:hypothetical protein